MALREKVNATVKSPGTVLVVAHVEGERRRPTAQVAVNRVSLFLHLAGARLEMVRGAERPSFR